MQTFSPQAAVAKTVDIREALDNYVSYLTALRDGLTDDTDNTKRLASEAAANIRKALVEIELTFDLPNKHYYLTSQSEPPTGAEHYLVFYYPVGTFFEDDDFVTSGWYEDGLYHLGHGNRTRRKPQMWTHLGHFPSV